SAPAGLRRTPSATGIAARGRTRSARWPPAARLASSFQQRCFPQAVPAWADRLQDRRPARAHPRRSSGFYPPDAQLIKPKQPPAGLLVARQVLRLVGAFRALDRLDAAPDRQLDLTDRARDLDPARAGGRAVENRAAAPHAIGIGHDLQALVGDGVAVVEDEAVRLNDRRRANVHVIRPIARAGRRAARAQDTLGRVVEQRTRLGRLQPLAPVGRDRRVVDDIRHDLAIVGEERLHIDYQVLYHLQPG